MKIRKFVCLALALSLIMAMLAGCGSSANTDTPATPSTPSTSSPAPVESEEPAASEDPVTSEEPAASEEPGVTENAVDFNGTYKCIVMGPMGEQNINLIVTTDENGNVTGSYNNYELTSGVLNGNQFELKTEMQNPALGMMEVTITGTVDGENIAGSVVTVVSTAELTGTRE